MPAPGSLGLWSDILEIVELKFLKGKKVFLRREVWRYAEGVLLETSFPLTNLIDPVIPV
jgi:hypothetical protein